jgi:hypothetical protein
VLVIEKGTFPYFEALPIIENCPPSDALPVNLALVIERGTFPYFEALPIIENCPPSDALPVNRMLIPKQGPPIIQKGTFLQHRILKFWRSVPFP